jgi:uncharacterized protein (TIRG00374 family)
MFWKQKKNIISIILSVCVSAVLITLLLTKINTKDILTTFSNIYIPALIAFAVISLVGTALRAWRYKTLLLPQEIRWGEIFLVTFIRNLFVDFFPARIGSLSYVYVLTKNLKFPVEKAASSFVVAFVFDFLTLSPFLVFSILVVGIGTSGVSSLSLLIISLAFFSLIFLILWKLIPISQLALRVYEWVLKLFKLDEKKWSTLSVQKIRMTLDEIRHIKNKGIYWLTFIQSLGIRLAKYGALYFLLISLLRSHAYTLKELSFFKTILGITGAELSGALPIKGIGGFGTWESAWALTFQLLDFDSHIAVLSGIGVHLITNFFEYFLGVISILILASPVIKKNRNW